MLFPLCAPAPLREQKNYVITTQPQLKDLIVRSLTFVRDDIEMAGRSEGYRATRVSSRPQIQGRDLSFSS